MGWGAYYRRLKQGLRRRRRTLIRFAEALRPTSARHIVSQHRTRSVARTSPQIATVRDPRSRACPEGDCRTRSARRTVIDGCIQTNSFHRGSMLHRSHKTVTIGPLPYAVLCMLSEFKIPHMSTHTHTPVGRNRRQPCRGRDIGTRLFRHPAMLAHAAVDRNRSTRKHRKPKFRGKKLSTSHYGSH